MRYKRCVTFALVASGLFVSSSVFATSYSYDVDVQFNFNSKLGVTITDADIKILDLAPGTSADSNIVGITISTNNVAGYTAEATVGNANNATTNMTHANGTNTFTSIATDASQASLTTDNTWGYAVSTDNGTSWSNFSGLPVYTEDGKELASTDSPASDAIQFKINAKASTSQPAGDYTNVINFKVVANKVPNDWEDVKPNCTTDPTKCDDVTHLPKIQVIGEDICEAVETYDTQFQVTDSRDHKNYWISKLRDDHCWMTQNLDLDLDSSKTYTHADTDLGWGNDKSTTTWKPTNSTIPVENIGQYGWISDWAEDKNVPYSMDTGDWYWTDTWYESTSNNYTDGDLGDPAKFAQTPYTNNGTHGHVGNYYNWPATIASNDASGYTTNTSSDPSNNPQNSICPAGWRLPTIRVISSVAYFDKDVRNEYEYLLNQYGNYSYGSYGSDNILAASPLYFVRGGRISLGRDGGYLFYSGSFGYYWSSTANDGNDARIIQFTSSNILPTTYKTRNLGHSIRCLVRADDRVVVTFLSNDGYLKTQQIKKNSSTELASNSFARSGYIFNGWNTRADGLGEGYGDGVKVSFDSDATLYAQWKQDDGSAAGITIQRAYELAYTQNHKGMYEQDLDDIDNDGDTSEYIEITDDHYHNHDVRFAMQDIDMIYNDNGTNKKVCDLVTVLGDQYQALDVRDSKLYYISKLADGRCWMTQNLDLDLSPNRTLLPTDTDVATAWTPAYATNDIHWSNATTEEHYEWMRGVTSNSVDFGDYYWQGRSNVPDEGQQFVDSKPFTDFYDLSGNAHYHLGNYYTFAAALATNDGSVYGDNQVVNNQSICPKGWRLPDASNSVGSINYLNGLYTSSGPYAAPLYMHPAEHWNDGSDHLGNIGEFTKTFSTAYYTLNRTSPTKTDSDNEDNYQKQRYFHPGGASGIPSPDTIPQAYPSIPRYLSIPVRCLSR